jgi:sulfur carrier protein ThiS
MPVLVILRKEHLEVPAPTSVGAALEVLGIPPEQYLVIYRGELVGVDQPLSEGDTIQLVGVISGGKI